MTFHQATNRRQYPAGVFLIRDSWDSAGFRVYHATDAETNICIELFNKKVYGTVSAAADGLRALFGPDIAIYRERADHTNRKLWPLPAAGP